MKHRWVGGKVCAWSDGSEMGHDYRGWVMIQGAGSDEAWVGHDYRGWVMIQGAGSDFKL